MSYALSPTWAVELLRMGVWGVADPAAFGRKLAVLLALTALSALLALALFRAIDRQVRILATLEVR